MAKGSPFEAPKLIILVEDQAVIRALAAELLRDAGFVVIEAENADVALRILARLSSAVDILFTDVQMPGEMNGLALISYVHKTWPWISLLLTSAHTPPVLLNLPPAARFLSKPYMAEHLVNQVRELALIGSAACKTSPALDMTQASYS